MQRLQRKRTKGWRMPPNARYVGRGSRWGNPFELNEDKSNLTEVLARYEIWLDEQLKEDSAFLDPLIGKDYLACWCRLDNACHADILLKRLSFK